MKLIEAKKIFEQAYDILVDICGADKVYKSTFVDSLTSSSYLLRTNEWRILGGWIGGKFYLNENSMYVFSREESTDSRVKDAMEKINYKLQALPFPGIPPYEH
jgi:hypothetical protein